MGVSHRDPTEDFETLDPSNTSPQGIWSNGALMWVADDDNDKVYAYSLFTKQRQSSQDFNTLIAAGNNSPRGIWSDGETVWVADETDSKIYAYDMVTKAHDATKDFDSLATTEGNTSPRGVWSDGTTMWVADEGSDTIFAYLVESMGRYADNDLSAADNQNPYGIWSDGEHLWVAEDSGSDPENARVLGYDVDPNQRSQYFANDNDNLIPAGNTSPRGLWHSGGTMWVSDEEDAKIYAYRDTLKNPYRTVRRSTIDTSDDEIDPARASSVDTGECVAEIVDPDGGRVELGDVIAGRWVSGCPSVTRGGRLAMYYTFDLPITTAAQIALDSHLDDYLVLRLGGLTGTIVEQDDDDGPGNNSLIDRVLTAGRYTIEATTFYADGVEADFTLTVRAVPRVLYDGPVADVASPGYAPVGPTLTVKLLPTQPMGTLEITVEDNLGFGEGAGPLGGTRVAGGSSGAVVLAVPKTAWVEYVGITVEARQSGSWGPHTQGDEQAMLTRRAVVLDLGPAFLSLVRLIGKVEGALELLQSLAVVAPFAAQDAGPGEAVLDDIFRRSHANCVSQLTVPWLVDAPATSGVRVSVPLVLSDGDHLSLAVSFVAGGGLPALAQLHDLLGTGGDAPACQPPQLVTP